MTNTKKAKLSVKQMTVIGLMTAILCIISPFSLAIPISPVPISLGTLAVYFAVTVLGMKRGTVSVVLYLLLGLAGLPVFTGFTGGIGKVLGPTGGYMLGYIFIALSYGFFVEHWNGKLIPNIVGGVIGTFLLYLFGTLWLAYQLHLTFAAALWAGVIPYIPGDAVKLAIAMSLGIQLRKRLIKAGLV